jgi:hypothetical protein
VNYHPDIVLMLFRQEKKSAAITLDNLERFDADLHSVNNDRIVAACIAAGIENPSKFDRSRVLGLAILSLGGAGKVGSAARAYKEAVDAGVIG